MIHIAMQNDNRGTAMHKIALEEHFMLPEFVDYWSTTFENISPELAGKALGALSDFRERRLASMDSDGIGLALLSIAGPGVQAERDTGLAIGRARQANDFLAEEMARRPDRYGGLAHLPLQDPVVAADELTRCIRDLKMGGAMIN